MTCINAAGSGAGAHARKPDMNQIVIVLCLAYGLVEALAAPAPVARPRPDSAGVPPLPGPGLSYGGIPYGSMSGNVAEYFKRQATPGGRHSNFAEYAPAPAAVNYAPIEQWL